MGVLLRADLKRHLFWQLALCLFSTGPKKDSVTGKSFSEALILVSTNPQYDIRLFIELRVQHMKIPSSEHVVYINCSECQNKSKKNQSG